MDISAKLFLPWIATILSCIHHASRLVDALPTIDGGKPLQNVSPELFSELEELSRLVDIAYCVGLTGVWPPFECMSRCKDFPEYTLVTTWNTGPLLSDSCGYIVLDHSDNNSFKEKQESDEKEKTRGRIIVVFRGTYSISSTIVDLTTMPQEYVPYPGDPDSETTSSPEPINWFDLLMHPWRNYERLMSYDTQDIEKIACVKYGSDEVNEMVVQKVDFKHKRWEHTDDKKEPKCENCTVHSGFLISWLNTRKIVLEHVERAKYKYPEFDVHLVGHSLGGAVAALAGLELEIKGYSPIVTTFGEPRIGNKALVSYLDDVFSLTDPESSLASSVPADGNREKRFRRVTHKDDPIPLLPLTEWGYRMHAGEIYISKYSLQPNPSDIWHCEGDEDVRCIAGAEPGLQFSGMLGSEVTWEMKSESRGETLEGENEYMSEVEKREKVDEEGWKWPAKYRMWQIIFAHRDYFWRLGLCVPGGDPADWLRRPYRPRIEEEAVIGAEELK